MGRPKKMASLVEVLPRGPRTPVKKRDYTDHCPPGFITRNMLLERVGITSSTLLSLESRGIVVKARRNSAGRSLYKESVIQTLLNRKNDGSLDTIGIEPLISVRYTAEEGIKVFQLLDEGKPLARIVIDAQIHPQIVKAINQEYNSMNGSINIPLRVLEQMNRAKLEGNFPIGSATDLLEILQAAEKDRLCVQCEDRLCANACAPCLKKQVLAAAAAAAEKAELLRAEKPEVRVSPAPTLQVEDDPDDDMDEIASLPKAM